MSFCGDSCWKSSTEPRDESEVEDADAVGESLGEPAAELAEVDGAESTVTLRLMAVRCGSAVVLIVTAGREAVGCVGEIAVARRMSKCFSLCERDDNSAKLRQES